MKYMSITVASICLCLAVEAKAEECPPMRYATQLAEASGQLRAKAQSKLLSSLASRLRAERGDKTGTVKADIGGRYAVAAAGGLAQTAYSETITTYFCKLREEFVGSPAKVTSLKQEEIEMKLSLLKYFDIGRWQISAIEARDEMGEDIESADHPASIFSVAEISSAMPDYTFDTLKIYEIFGGFSVGDTLGVEGCGGIVTRSVRQIHPSVLSDLEYMQYIISQWLASDKKSAQLELWNRVNAQMTAQLVRSQNEEELRINDSLISCVEKAAQAAEAKAQEEVASPAPTPATPAA